MQEKKYSNIDKLLENVDIIKTIGQVVKLKKVGANFIGLCPFHDDKNPSMSVSPKKQIFKCFSCGAGGNSIKFIQDYYKLSFIDAVKKLIEINDLQKDDYLDFFNSKISQIELLKNRYFEITEFVSNLYNYQLMNLIQTKNNLSFEFLKSRKINKSAIKNFKIGSSEGLENFVTILKENKEFGFEDLLDIGLITYHGEINKEIEFKEIFKNRIIFPIIDINNHIIAYAGRSLFEDSIKYFNTKNSKIFIKSDHFFNEISLKNNNSNIYITEGYLDVITMVILGFKTVLGTMGMYLSQGHINLLKKANEFGIILVPDTDSPGLSGCLKNLILLFKNGVYNIKGIILDNNFKDINQFYCNFSASEKKDYIEYLSKKTFDLFELIIFLINNTNLKNDVKNSFFKIIKNINDEILQQNLLKKLSNFFKIEYNLLFKSFFTNSNFFSDISLPNENKAIKSKEKGNSFEDLELLILNQIIIHQKLKEVFFSMPCNFNNELYKKVLFFLLFDTNNADKYKNIINLLNTKQLNNDKINNLIKSLEKIDQKKPEYIVDKIKIIDFQNLIISHLILEKKENIIKLISDIRKCNDFNKKFELLENKFKQEKLLSDLLKLLNQVK
ncbi:DNA primase [Mycoplasma sp. SG1]|uniref:DNA primase n=1 Tax=Mycoplasma sp. SG1 TaxID=2810348 RepID=UPI0020240DFF|nr:DNA primase [Mycoplasma sp. SG1]URM53145.1 DNA primase [Mycoplasma sp. SG1]